MRSTILIGLDGATFTVLDPLMQEGVMPFLKSFLAGGVRSPLDSTPHPLTPPAWTSMVTGRSPGNHGVFDFVRVERGAEHPRYTLATSRDVRCETIWSIVSRHGRTAATFNFPVTFPPKAISGYVVPGFVPWRHLRRAVHPPELYDRLRALPGFAARELALDWEQEQKAIQALPEEDYEEWIRFHIRREQHWFDAFIHFVRHDPCDLMAIVFDGVDKLQHLCWRFLDPRLTPESPSPWERKIRELSLEYFRRLDGFIAEIVRHAGREARIFLASDHGFGPSDQIFYANVWLAEQGYLKWRDGVSIDRGERLSPEGNRSSVVLFDWSETVAAALTASSNAIYLQVSEDGRQPGMPAAAYDEVRARLVASLLDFRDPATGERVVSRILTREEAFPGEHVTSAPDLTLVLRDHGFLSVLNAEKPLVHRSRVVGTHYPEGVFMAAGPGIRAGETLSRHSILDVASTLLYSAGVPIREDLEGRLALALFEPAFLAAHPVRTEAPMRSPEAPPDAASAPEGDATLDAEAEAEILEQLRALGYIE